MTEKSKLDGKAGKSKRAGAGRPSSYTKEIGAKICARIALREPLSKICSEKGMPCEWTVYQWKIKHEEFAANLAHAREQRAEARADRIDDYLEQLKAGKLDPNSARVLIDGERFQMSKENPRRYGDRIMSEVAITATIHAETVSDTQKWIEGVLATEERSNVIRLLPPNKDPIA